MKSKNVTMAIVAIAMGILILDSRIAIGYASEALELCLRTVIPSLFPLCVLGNLLTNQLQSARSLRPLGAAFGLRQGTESILLAGLLGGYPIGAQNIAIAFRTGTLTKDEANRMLSFCSQPGPAFLFGMLGSVFSLKECILLWMVVAAGAWIVSLLFPQTGHSPAAVPHPEKAPPAVKSAVSSMGNICGWIILMRILLGFLERWVLWILPEPVQCTVAGILELTNGCLLLNSIADPGLRFILAAAMLSFGGICIMLQTGSLVSGLDMRFYMGGKLLQCGICVCLACALTGSYLALLPLLSGAIGYLAVKFRKNSSFPAPVGV